MPHLALTTDSSWERTGVLVVYLLVILRNASRSGWTWNWERKEDYTGLLKSKVLFGQPEIWEIGGMLMVAHASANIWPWSGYLKDFISMAFLPGQHSQLVIIRWHRNHERGRDICEIELEQELDQGNYRKNKMISRKWSSDEDLDERRD